MASPGPTITLRRELGKWDLAAIGINQTIGSAIFILPSQVAAQIEEAAAREANSIVARYSYAPGNSDDRDAYCEINH